MLTGTSAILYNFTIFLLGAGAVMTEYISHNGIEYEIRRSSRRLRTVIGVRGGGFFIAAPDKMPIKNIVEILNRHGSEIIEKLSRKKETVRCSAHSYEEGEFFFFRGQEYPLEFREGNGIRPLVLENGIFYSEAGLEKEEVRHNFGVWYKLKLHEILQEAFPCWCKRIGASPRCVALKEVRTLWGSCSTSRNITFSIRLALVPQPLLEYVVIHELCHLTEMNHSARFWELVERYCPDYKERRRKLKACGYKYNW